MSTMNCRVCGTKTEIKGIRCLMEDNLITKVHYECEYNLQLHVVEMYAALWAWKRAWEKREIAEGLEGNTNLTEAVSLTDELLEILNPRSLK